MSMIGPRITGIWRKKCIFQSSNFFVIKVCGHAEILIIKVSKEVVETGGV